MLIPSDFENVNVLDITSKTELKKYMKSISKDLGVKCKFCHNMNDKSIDSMLELLPNTAKYYFTQAQIPRALNSNELKLKAAEFELYGESFETVDQAFSSAIMHSSENDLIFVGGSIFVIAEIPSL